MYSDIIESFPNVSEESLSSLKIKDNGKKGYGQSFDLNWENRQRLAQTLAPIFTERHGPLLRFLLEQEIAFCGRYDGDPRLMRGLAYMLYTVADIDDAELFYRAKFDTTFDASIEVDIELLFGENKERTKAHFIGKHQGIVEEIERYEVRPFVSKSDYVKRVQKHRLLDYWIGDDEE